MERDPEGRRYRYFEFEATERGAIDDLVLVQLYEEAEYGERTFDVLPGGVNLEAVIPVTTERLDDGTYRLRPAEPLGLGEFGFIRLETGDEITRGLTVHLRSGLLDTAGHDTWTGVLVIETDPPIVMTHVPMGMLPPGWVNLHGHVHNHAPPGDTPHINVSWNTRTNRPLPLGSLVTLAKHLLAGDVPEGATTDERIRNAGAPTDKRSVAEASSCGSTGRATGQPARQGLSGQGAWAATP